MKYFILIIALFFSVSTFSQVEKDSELYKKLATNDSLLFTAGLNKCNTKIMSKLIHSDFEFYHDKGGIDRGKDVFFEGINKMCNRRNGK